MKRWSLILIGCLLQFSLAAQFIDVFQNKTYTIANHILKSDIEREYLSSKVGYVQSINRKEDWNEVEEKLKEAALGHLKDETKYFLIHTRANNIKKQIEKQKKIDNYSRSSTLQSPDFEGVDISLISILNGIGTYTVEYEFTLGNSDHEAVVTDYYLVDYAQKTVRAFGSSPNQRQQEVLKKLTLSKFQSQYLLQTQKVGLSSLERITKLQEKSAENQEFSAKIDYREAVVYPFFSGAIVEFPSYSKSSKIFGHKSFRLFINGEKLAELLTVYPVLKPAYSTALKRPSEETIAKLNNDDFFDIGRFSRMPSAEQAITPFIESCKEADKKIYSVNIKTYQQRDTIKTYSNTRKLFFNENGDIYKTELRDKSGTVVREETKTYSESSLKSTVKNSTDEKELSLYHYEQGTLGAVEHIILRENRSYYENGTFIRLYDEYYAFSGNNRYLMTLHLIGDDRPYFRTRSENTNEYCADKLCILTKDNGQVAAIRSKTNSAMDVLINSDNQPVESFLDNDRYRYYFTYDEDKRITSFMGFDGLEKNRTMEYTYDDRSLNFLNTIETRSRYNNSNQIIQEFEVEYR